MATFILAADQGKKKVLAFQLFLNYKKKHQVLISTFLMLLNPVYLLTRCSFLKNFDTVLFLHFSFDLLWIF